MKHSMKNLFPLARKTTSAVRNRKIEENWFTPNFKHCVHQQKKALNKSTKFVINRKSISTSQNEGFLEKCYFTELKSYFHSSKYLKKTEENGFLYTSRNNFFLNIGLPLIAIRVSKKI